MTSFRLRLALLVGSLTATLLLGAGYFAWDLTSNFNRQRLDRELEQLARQNLNRVAGAGHWSRLDAALSFVSRHDGPPAYAIWVRTYDREEYRSPHWPAGLRPEDLPVAEDYEGGVTFDTPPPPPRKAGLSPENPSLPIRHTRFFTLPGARSTWRLAVTGNPYTTLVLAANLDATNRDLQQLRRRFLAVLPIVLLVVGVAAWWFATRALRPVAALTQAAESLTARGLDQRLAAPAHDREFQRLITVFNAMLDRLEHSFHQARRFSADASHELKTPLALLQAEVEQALHVAPSGSSLQQTYTSLLEEILRLRAILEKLLLLSLADSGRLTLDRTATNLSAMVTTVIEDCAALAPGLNLEYHVPGQISVPADQVLLEQALQNLLQNAVKYNRPGGTIRISLACTAAHALITVGNTGPGIPEAVRPRLFERFYRGDPARVRDRASGVGLGLSLSREILRAHGGDLVLQPAAEDWTEFVASLPRAGLNGTTHSP